MEQCRRIPLKPSHRWLATIAYRIEGKVGVNALAQPIPWAASRCVQTMVATHSACPFGAASSVHAWERIGAVITEAPCLALQPGGGPWPCACPVQIARKILKLVAFRYVDDLFGPERCVENVWRLQPRVVMVLGACVAGRAQTMEHAMQCVARLIRALLGKDSVADKKLECGETLKVLGIQLSMDRSGSCDWGCIGRHAGGAGRRGYCCRPAKDKAQKCQDVMRKALLKGELDAGAAQKLAGRLCWASQFMFRRLGRAMLRPIFHHGHGRCDLSVGRVIMGGPLCCGKLAHERGGSIDEHLRSALEWWIHILDMDIVEEHAWNAPDTPLAHLFVDARGPHPTPTRS